jgi:hypothetical protein
MTQHQEIEKKWVTKNIPRFFIVVNFLHFAKKTNGPTTSTKDFYFLKDLN